MACHCVKASTDQRPFRPLLLRHTLFKDRGAAAGQHKGIAIVKLGDDRVGGLRRSQARLASRSPFVPGCEANARPTPLAKFWLTHPQRRQYDGLVFAPRRETPGRYNLWISPTISIKVG